VNKFSGEIVEFLMTFDVKAIVIACNTVSSNSYDYLKERYDIPFVEVVTPGVNACLKVTGNNNVGVIGTVNTVNSMAYDTRLKLKRPGIQVHAKACPLFVPLAEEGLTHSPITDLTVEMYLSELVEKGVDSIIMGCTHYPLIEAAIAGFARGINIVNPACETAQSLVDLLRVHGIFNESGIVYEPEFYVSDLNQEKFGEISAIALGKVCKAVKAEIISQ
jgi:glutamate racemase